MYQRVKGSYQRLPRLCPEASVANLKRLLVVKYGVNKVKNLGRPKDIYRQREKAWVEWETLTI